MIRTLRYYLLISTAATGLYLGYRGCTTAVAVADAVDASSTPTPRPLRLGSMHDGHLCPGAYSCQ